MTAITHGKPQRWVEPGPLLTRLKALTVPV